MARFLTLLALIWDMGINASAHVCAQAALYVRDHLYKKGPVPANIYWQQFSDRRSVILSPQMHIALQGPVYERSGAAS